MKQRSIIVPGEAAPPVESETSPEGRAVLGVCNDFFSAMERRDVELARTLVVPEGVLVSVRGEGSQRSSSNAEWLEGLPGRKQEVREHFTGEPVVMVDGDVAVVWSRYAFEVDGKPSHTGVDAFTLVRTGGVWKIAGGVYSVVPVE